MGVYSTHKINMSIYVLLIESIYKTLFYKVAARQNERRLEESKAEAGQLRNRLTLVEKNLNDTDPEAKLHRKYSCYITYTRI